MLDVFERYGERGGAIAGPVVGHHCGDGDAMVGEERSGSDPEAGGGVAAFIAEPFGVGQPRVIIDCVMQEHVAA